VIKVDNYNWDYDWDYEFEVFLGGLGFDFDAPSDLNLDGKGHALKCHDKEQKGKTYYVGGWQKTDDGKDYPTITVLSQAHGGEKLGNFHGLRDVLAVNRKHHERPERPERPAPIPSKEQIKAKAKAKEQSEQARKDAKRRSDIESFAHLSKTPTGTQNKYFDDKQIVDKLDGLDIRYGTDKHGQYATILLSDSKTGEAKGVQRFYDRNIKGRSTNKDFPYGTSKAGACYVMGDVANSDDVLLCEGFADGVLLHSILNKPIVVTLDAGNMQTATDATSTRYPSLDGINVCDNDAHKYDRVDNAGVIKGVEAARQNGYQYVIPEFDDLSNKPTDIWDLWQKGGDDAIKALFEKPKKPPVAEMTWLKFRLEHTGLRLKSPLNGLYSVIDDMIKVLSKGAFCNKYVILGEITKAIKKQTPRLESFDGYNEENLLLYAHKELDKLHSQALYTLQRKYADSLIKADESIDLKWFDAPLKHKTILIDSGVGTGKTVWIKNTFFDSLEFKEVLAAFPRTSLAQNAAKTLRAMDYIDYKKLSPKQRRETDARKMCIVPNSLALCGFKGDECFDVIVLDEAELLIHHCYSHAVKEDERPGMLKILRSLIKNAEYVIGSQANLSELTREFLASCGRSDIHVIRNKFQRFAGLPVNIYTTKADCTALLHSVIESGQPVLVPCGSINFTEELELELSSQFPHKKILLINRKTAGDVEQKAFLIEPNQYGTQYDIVIFSPVLEQGVSIDGDHFKRVIGFCNAGEKTGGPQSFSQMLSRARQVKQIDIWCEGSQESNNTNWQKYIYEAIGRFDESVKSLKLVTDPETGKQGYFFERTPDTDMAAKCKAALAAEKNDTIGTLYAILDGMGCNINIIHEGDTDLGKKILDGGKEKQKRGYQASTKYAAQITNSDYLKIKDSPNPTKDELDSATRFEMERDLAINLDDFDDPKQLDKLFADWAQGRGAKPVQALGEAVLSDDHAKNITKLQLDNNKFQLDNKACNGESHGFAIRHIIRPGLLKSLGGHFDHKTGELTFDGRWFRYDDFKEADWYKFACEHIDTVDGSGLGARIKGGKLTDKVLGYWIRALGLNLDSKRVDAACLKDGPEVSLNIYTNTKLTSGPNTQATDSNHVESDFCHKNVLKLGDAGPASGGKSKKPANSKRKRLRVYSVNVDAMQWLIDTLKRRFDKGTMPHVQRALKAIEANKTAIVTTTDNSEQLTACTCTPTTTISLSDNSEQKPKPLSDNSEQKPKPLYEYDDEPITTHTQSSLEWYPAAPDDRFMFDRLSQAKGACDAEWVAGGLYTVEHTRRCMEYWFNAGVVKIDDTDPLNPLYALAGGRHD